MGKHYGWTENPSEAGYVPPGFFNAYTLGETGLVRISIRTSGGAGYCSIDVPASAVKEISEGLLEVC